jgi:hypothetical protein
VLFFFLLSRLCQGVNAFQQRGYTTCRFIFRWLCDDSVIGNMVVSSLATPAFTDAAKLLSNRNGSRMRSEDYACRGRAAIASLLLRSHESRDSKGCSVGSHVRSLGWLCWGCVEGGRLRPSSMKPIRNENTRYIFIFQARIFASSFTLLCAVCTVLYVCMYVCMC